MPRFTGQNKKQINPRYFLNEVTDITRMDTLQDSGEFEDVLNAISLNKLFKFAEPYMEDDERAIVMSTDRDQLRGVLIDIIKAMPDAEGEEILDLASAAVASTKDRHQRNKRFLSKSVQR